MINNMLYILGAKMADVIGKPEMSCRGLLRYALIDNAENLDMSNVGQVMDYLNRMTYQDWRQLLESTTLARRMAMVGIANPEAIVDILKQTLVEHQSLLTISVR
jgi:hypothetical protein